MEVQFLGWLTLTLSAALQLGSMDIMGSVGVGYDELPRAPATPLETSTSVNDTVRDGGRLLAQGNPSTSIGPKNAFERGSRRLDNTRSWTLIQLLNYMIGSGILNAAQAFRDSGIAAAITLFTIVGGSSCCHFHPNTFHVAPCHEILIQYCAVVHRNGSVGMLFPCSVGSRNASFLR